jgi:hypothetical protein
VAALARLLRGDRPATAADAGDADLIALAEQHGVGPLLAECLRTAGQLPPASELAAMSRRAAAVDAIRQSELAGALAALRSHGVPVLVFKGAALAHTVYARPDLRPRMDSDLLVPGQHRASAHAALLARDYERVPQFTGDLVAYQAPYVIRRAGGIAHIIDLHWRVANPQQFGAVLDEADLFAGAIDVPALGAGARGPGPVHALLLACVHPVAHHGGAARLIWSFDVHLLASRLTAGEWDRFTALAVDRRVARVAAHGLAGAVEAFGTPVPARVTERLAGAASGEATAKYLAPARRHIQTIWGDFRTLSTWRDRWQLVQQHAFPPRDYMRRVYAPASGQPLPILYARRMYRGALKWLART